MNKEYIEREALVQSIEDNLHLPVSRIIKEAPTADVAPVVHGEWIPSPHIYGIYMCSRCRDMYDLCQPNFEEIDAWQFCPNCGARMDGGNSNEL